MDSASGAAARRGWYHGWNIVAVSILAQIAGVGLSVNAFSLFLKDWSADLHTPISTFQISLIATSIGSALVSPLFGAFSDKYPARWLFTLGLLVLAAFHLLVSFATAPWQIIALFGILLPIGLASGTTLVANAVVSRWFVRRRGLALGLTAFGLGMAGVILPPIIASVPADVGWRMVWRVAGLATALVVLPIVLLVVRDRPAERDGLHYLDGEAPAARSHHGGGKGGLRTIDVLKRRNFWLLLAAFIPIMAGYGAVSQNLAPIAASHGFSQQAAGAMISALGVAHIVATLGFGILSDRFGNSRPLCALSLAIGAAALLVGFGESFPVVAAGAALIGLAGGVYTLQAATIAVEFGGEGFGRAYGLSMCVIPLLGLGPFVTAKSQEATGSYTVALVGFAIACAVGAGLVLLMKEKRVDKGAAAPAPAPAAAAE
jgi:MFS family permease